MKIYYKNGVLLCTYIYDRSLEHNLKCLNSTLLYRICTIIYLTDLFLCTELPLIPFCDKPCLNEDLCVSP